MKRATTYFRDRMIRQAAVGNLSRRPGHARGPGNLLLSHSENESEELADLGRSGGPGTGTQPSRSLSTRLVVVHPRDAATARRLEGSARHAAAATGRIGRSARVGGGVLLPQDRLPEPANLAQIMQLLGRKSHVGVNVPSRPGALAQGERAGTPPPFPEDVSEAGWSFLDGSAARRRGHRSDLEGLLPGEPGASAGGECKRLRDRRPIQLRPAIKRPDHPAAKGVGTASGTAGGSQCHGVWIGLGQPPQPQVQGESSSSGRVAGGQSWRRGRTVARLRAPLRIEVPMEIDRRLRVRAAWSFIRGYRISLKAARGRIRSSRPRSRPSVRLRQQVDPMIRPKPSIRFLVEPGGGERPTATRARVTVLSGIEWPTGSCKWPMPRCSTSCHRSGSNGRPHRPTQQR